jgi:hypothetical protein
MTRPFYAFDSSFQGGEVYIKKLLAIIVLVPVVCTNARCTTTSNTTQTPSATSSAATQHEAFLGKLPYGLQKREVLGYQHTCPNLGARLD